MTENMIVETMIGTNYLTRDLKEVCSPAELEEQIDKCGYDPNGFQDKLALISEAGKMVILNRPGICGQRQVVPSIIVSGCVEQ
jgi:hypothetical protein